MQVVRHVVNTSGNGGKPRARQPIPQHSNTVLHQPFFRTALPVLLPVALCRSCPALKRPLLWFHSVAAFHNRANEGDTEDRRKAVEDSVVKVRGGGQYAEAAPQKHSTR